jgi:hypothetical protein
MIDLVILSGGDTKCVECFFWVEDTCSYPTIIYPAEFDINDGKIVGCRKGKHNPKGRDE